MSRPELPLPWRLPDPSTETMPRIRTLEAHAAGEPLRIVVDGLPAIPGDSILAKRRWARERLDDVRRTLILEPRGHRDMYGAILTEPVTPDGDLGVLFLHNEGFSTMCGHGVIALSAALRALGRLAPGEALLRIDTPAGRVEARVPDPGTGAPVSVNFRNVPSFVLAMDRTVHVESIGEVRYDLAFGGAFYAFVDAKAMGLPLRPEAASTLARTGRALQRAIATQGRIEHPHEEDLGFLYGVIFVGEAQDPRHHSRNVCVFGDGEVDRCPTGTGVSARAALHHARGEIALGETFTVESILGTTFNVVAEEEARVGTHAAVVPRVEGTGFLTGRAEYRVDPLDPLGLGVLLG